MPEGVGADFGTILLARSGGRRSGGGRSGGNVREGGDRVKARRRILPFLVVSGALFAALPGVANGDRGTLWAEMKRSADKGEGIRPSGLEPVFLEKFRCPEIASPFGSQTRYDGSRRPSWAPGRIAWGHRHHADGGNQPSRPGGGHGRGQGRRRTDAGNLRLAAPFAGRHGSALLGFSKYQHLEALPEIPIGAKVSLGQLIGRSGKTGTTGGTTASTGIRICTLRLCEAARANIRSRSQG